jgi:hypothetical protein
MKEETFSPNTVHAKVKRKSSTDRVREVYHYAKAVSVATEYIDSEI